MRYLFVHQNFPGQYKHLVAHLRSDPMNEVVFLTEREDRSMANVKKIVYKTARSVSKETHHYLRQVEHAILRGQAVARVALALKKQGFLPDIMIGHNAWGEILYLKDVFPDVPLLGYFEFFRKPWGGCLDFDPEFPADDESRAKIRTLGSIDLLGLNTADWGQTPTEWQRSQHPAEYQKKITVVHEGIDTDVVKPDANATLNVDGITLSRKDEVITYVARNLEPYRGFHIFMRALPAILKRRPKAQVVIVGGDDVSYGRLLAKGETYRGLMLREVGSRLDMQRVHFMGWLPYEQYLKVLQVSSVHVYLTYPFVLSWSMLEAMAAGCLIVGSATAPVKEVIKDGQNGLLADFFSCEQIAKTIDSALQQPELAAQLRASARLRVVEHFDLKRKALPAQIKLIGHFTLNEVYLQANDVNSEAIDHKRPQEEGKQCSTLSKSQRNVGIQ
jgi:glycosyltransferase involved in cell wall biosynthesis